MMREWLWVLLGEISTNLSVSRAESPYVIEKVETPSMVNFLDSSQTASASVWKRATFFWWEKWLFYKRNIHNKNLGGITLDLYTTTNMQALQDLQCFTLVASLQMRDRRCSRSGCTQNSYTKVYMSRTSTDARAGLWLPAEPDTNLSNPKE